MLRDALARRADRAHRPDRGDVVVADDRGHVRARREHLGRRTLAALELPIAADLDDVRGQDPGRRAEGK